MDCIDFSMWEVKAAGHAADAKGLDNKPARRMFPPAGLFL
jgi:hypothetical protein